MDVLRAVGVVAATLLSACCLPVQAGDGSRQPPTTSHLAAVEFLKYLPREWSSTSAIDCRTYEEKNIDKLTPGFAVAAAEFLRAFVAVHGSVTITSAHRDAKEQACVCVGEKGPCAGKPRVTRNKNGKRIVKRGGASRHQLGIALDVRPGMGTSEEFACLHEFAGFNPRFAVRFPLGKRDRPHMEPAPPQAANVKMAALGSLAEPFAPCASMRIMLTDRDLD